MKNLIRIVLAAALLAPALALAQASAQFRIDLPVVLPPMVVVQPGVQVVQDVDEEVFFSNGWYWVRRDDGWYRSRSHRHGWMFVQRERVPRRLGMLPPGQYRHWHAPPPAPRPMPARYHPAPPPPRYEPRYEPAHAVGHEVDRRGPPPKAENHGHDRGGGKDHHDNGRHEGW